MSNSVCVSSGPLSNHRARQNADLPRPPPSGPLHPLHSSARRRRGDFPPSARHLLQKSSFCVWVPARCSHPAYGDPSPALRGSGALARRGPPCQNRQISAVRGALCQIRQISAARGALCQIRQSPSKRRPPSGPYYPPLRQGIYSRFGVCAYGLNVRPSKKVRLHRAQGHRPLTLTSAC